MKLKRLMLAGFVGLAGCGQAEKTKTQEAKPVVVRKDGWVVLPHPDAVCVEHGGEIRVVEQGSVTIIRFGTDVPHTPRPPLPPIPPTPPSDEAPPPPTRSTVPPEGKPFPPATPRVPPPEGTGTSPDPLPLPSPLPSR